MPYRFGDILLLPFPYTEGEETRKRPAVVLSSRAYDKRYDDVLVAKISSQNPRRRGLGEVLVRDWEASGLLTASKIRPVIMTIKKHRIERVLGRLDILTLGALREALPTWFG